MKKTIFGIFIGIILTLGVVAIATNINASEVDYKNDKKVSDALDDLYQASNTCIRLTTATDFVAEDLLTGKKAYNSNGELITGTSTKEYTESEYQEYGNTRYEAGRNSVKQGTFTSISGDNTINLGFTPKKMIVYRDGMSVAAIYDESYSTTNYIFYNSNKTLGLATIGTGRWGSTINGTGGTTASYYYKTIGNNVSFHTDTAGNVWTYYATE